MTRYVGQHRIDPPRGRHRVERLQLAAVDPLLGASGALATGAVAAIFLSGAVVLPHLDPGAPFRTSEPPSVAAPGSAPGAQPTVSAEGRSMDLSAWLAPATTTGACSACGTTTLTGPVATSAIRTASTAALLAETSTTGSSLTDPGSASPSDTAPAAPSADGTPGGATTPAEGTPTDGTPTDGTPTPGDSTTPGGSTTIPADATTPDGGTTTTPRVGTTTPGGGTTTDPGTCGRGTPPLPGRFGGGRHTWPGGPGLDPVIDPAAPIASPST